MRLEFQRRHLSIIGFPSIELPALTIILGLNGSGKTHLLQAIQNGAVHNSVAPVNPLGGRSLAPMPVTNGGPIRLLSNTSLNTAPQSVANPAMNTGPIAETTYNTQPHISSFMPGPPGIDFEHNRRAILNRFVAPFEAALGQALSFVLKENEDPWRLGGDELMRRAE